MKEKILDILDKIKGVSIDSRKVKQGEIFVALKGEKTHGALYAEEALKKGAIYSVVPEEFKNTYKNERILFVKDTFSFLVELAKHRRKKIKSKVIAITGSVGKTTTKFMISFLLSKANRKVYPSPKSFNNFIGVSLTLLNAPFDAEYIVTEIGINKKGEMEELSDLVKPDIGILTKIGPSHLEGLENLEGVFEEKTKLFEKLPNSGFAIINRNSPFPRELKQKQIKFFIIWMKKNLDGTVRDLCI